MANQNNINSSFGKIVLSKIKKIKSKKFWQIKIKDEDGE